MAASGLRGRGGAGFPTSLKWELAAKSAGERKYVICNADEGEPGTFKDRVILAEFADLVFEGMTIGAWVIGAADGIVYLRAEYTYLRPHLEAVLQRRRDAGLLGPAVAGQQDFAFDIAIRMGSGAYVCGEETALIESLEGQRGEPRNRPPFPIDTGFLGNPTIVNNVETFAWVTCVLTKGPDWFKSIGTEKSTGRKLFSVSGDCARPGVYEFPMGITVAELLKEVGGRRGQSGADRRRRRPVRARRAFRPDHRLRGHHHGRVGDRARPAPRPAPRVAKFPGVLPRGVVRPVYPLPRGIPKLLEGVELLQHGRCSMNYLKELCDLGETMQQASKCGLGQSAPNALLSIVEHFQDEILGRVGTERSTRYRRCVEDDEGPR